MIAPVEPVFPGMIPANAYAKKHGLANSTVHSLARRGKIGHRRDGVFLHVDDVPPPTPTKGRSHRGDAKFCGGCGLWKPLSEYSPSRRVRPGGLCRQCNAHRERVRSGKATSPESISYKREIVAQLELQEAREHSRLREREARIQAHAERIEAMGLCGDGEDWPDGKD